MASSIELECFGAFASSGFQTNDGSTWPSVMDEKTTMDFHLTGTFHGIDAIAEYLSFFGDVFNPTGLVPISAPVLNLTGSTASECFLSIAGGYRMEVNQEYTPSGEPACVDSMIANNIHFTRTGNSSSPIYIRAWNVWADDEWMKLNFGAFDSEATIRYMCNVILEDCEDSLHSGKCASSIRRRRQLHQMHSFDECMKEMGDLPTLSNDFWADGDNRLCRYLHGSFAKTNELHCPHVSLELEADVNGDLKCVESKGTTVEDLFSPNQLEFFRSYGLPYDESSFIQAYTGLCPSIEELMMGSN